MRRNLIKLSVWPILSLTGKYNCSIWNQKVEQVSILYSQVNTESACLYIGAIMVHRKTDTFQFVASEWKSICRWDWLNRSHYFIVTLFLCLCVYAFHWIIFTKSFYKFQKSVFCPDSVNFQGNIVLLYLYGPLEMGLSSLSSPTLFYFVLVSYWFRAACNCF